MVENNFWIKKIFQNLFSVQKIFKKAIFGQSKVMLRFVYVDPSAPTL